MLVMIVTVQITLHKMNCVAMFYELMLVSFETMTVRKFVV